MPSCSGIKANGERCRGIAKAGSDYCPAHNPERAQARRVSASKAARAKGPSGELAEVKNRLRDLAEKTLKGEVSTSKASVAAQVLGVYLRAVEIERKIVEQELLFERIEALESLTEQDYKRGSRWGG